MDELSERDLLARARDYDEAALGAIFDRYYPLLYRYLYVHIGHRETAEDVAQAVFMRLLDAIRAGRAPDSYLKAWLFRTATNLLIDEARAAKFRAHDELADDYAADAAEPDADIDAQAILVQAREALARLNTAQRSVITMRFFGEMDFEDIARALGLTVSAVKAHQHRGLAALREAFSREETQ